ncbi:unnamed protein product [Strongylus vulgaris]|uniref:Uncharacterized protein n=1 Tax=Strongylus vulgaris TaxID=40348 RepID=A0A3P7JCL1_STRVU|nr:unnamed protein product [Strongylus vulgaris]
MSKLQCMADSISSTLPVFYYKSKFYPIAAADVSTFEKYVKSWDGFVDEIEKKLNEKIGPCSTNVEEGGSYIKLIGIPFRKLYDEQEALKELKAQRRSAEQLVGWNALLRMVEKFLADEIQHSPDERRPSESTTDQTSFITHKGGAILVNRSGTVFYKYIEDEGTQWPSVEEIVEEVKKVESLNPSKSSMTNKAKVDSELSANNTEEKKKSCCTIL